MKNISTPSTHNAGTDIAIKHAHSTAHLGNRTPAPRKSTISAIKQFARAYSYTTTLPVALGGFIAN